MTALDRLLAMPGIWRGGGSATAPVMPTGWAALDAVLPGGGWPCGALTELFVTEHGIGEIGILLPALARISADGRPQAWIAPPMLPYPPALDAVGLDLSRLLVIEPPDAERAWTIEECLRAEGCGAVVAWTGPLDGRRLRRLQLAAAASGACGFLFGAHRRQPSPAALRLVLAPSADGIEVTMIKARGKLYRIGVDFNACSKGAGVGQAASAPTSSPRRRVAGADDARAGKLAVPPRRRT